MSTVPNPPKQPWWTNLKLWLIATTTAVGTLLVLLLTGKQNIKKDFVEVSSQPDEVLTESGQVVTLPKTQTEGQLTAKKTAAVDTTAGSLVQGQQIQAEPQVQGTAAPGKSAGDALFGPEGSKP